MFEEAQLYAPVTRSAEGDVQVHLADDHPGATDEVYRARRNTIAALALAWHPGEPIPRAAYTEEEHEVWRVACAHLDELHETLACAEYLEGKRLLGLPEDHVPQLDDVTELLAPLTGFRYIPAAGLVPLRDFYGSLADRLFHSTQYIRHYSVPLYTPEPDVVHEVVGHANCLALPRFAALYQVGRGGRSTRRDDGGAGVRLQGVLVLPRVRRAPRAGRCEDLRRRAALQLRRDAGVPGARTSGPWRSAPWACRRTTSRTISRSCSAPTPSDTSRTWSGRSSRPSTTMR